MTEAPRRKWLQVHLSTAVVLMFAAGGMMWLNVTGHKTLKPDLWLENYFVEITDFGFPLVAKSHYSRPEIYFVRESDYWNEKEVVIDALFALAILFAVWFICEWWIRRGESRYRN